jgi:hypothetical protein
MGDLAEDSRQAVPDNVGVLSGIDTVPDTLLSVVVDDRDGLFVVRIQTLLQGLSVVVGSLNEGFAGDVVSEGLLGRVEFDVV